MTGLEITEIRNNDIKKSLFEDVLFFMIAGSGAEGEAGEITFINSTGQVFHGNHVDGDIKLKKLLEAFPVLKNDSGKKPSGWHEVYLGSGNSLLVRDDVYEDFWATLNPDKRNDESYRYQNWLDVAYELIRSKTQGREKTLPMDHSSELWQNFNDVICGESNKIAPFLKKAILLAQGNGEEFYDLYANSRNVDPEDQELIKGCWNFVKYQWAMYEGNSDLFKQEGFMIGSPWHGDIENAPILFLSVNPSITAHDFFPRWHPDTNPANDCFTMGSKTAGKVLNYATGCGHDGETVNNFITPKEIFNFFTNRFQTTPFHVVNSKSRFDIWLENNGNIAPRQNKDGSFPKLGVAYWNGMLDVMDALLPDNGKSPSKNPEERARGLMRSVLSSEVIPFGSAGVGNLINPGLLKECWKRFTRPLLKNCGAKIVFLVTNYVRNVFCEDSGISTSDFPNGTICTKSHPYTNRYGEPLLFVAINFLSPGNSKWYPQNYHQPVQDLLSRARANNELVCQALAKARELYNN